MGMIGYLARLSSTEEARLRADPEGYLGVLWDLESAGSDRVLDVDKAWDGIVHVAEARHMPVQFFGDVDAEYLTGTDWGYGPPGIVGVSDVELFARAVEDTTADDLLGADAATVLRGAYPFSAEIDAEDVAYVRQHLTGLLAFARAAAAARDAVVAWIS